MIYCNLTQLLSHIIPVSSNYYVTDATAYKRLPRDYLHFSIFQRFVFRTRSTAIYKNQQNRNLDSIFSAHTTSLEEPSSGTLKVKRIDWKSEFWLIMFMSIYTIQDCHRLLLSNHLLRSTTNNIQIRNSKIKRWRIFTLKQTTAIQCQRLSKIKQFITWKTWTHTMDGRSLTFSRVRVAHSLGLWVVFCGASCS